MYLKNKLGKRGDVEYLWFLIYIPLILAILFLLAWAIDRNYKDYIDTHNIEKYILYQRAFYSPNGIIYQDPITKRAYPGMIDMKKFSDEDINQLYNDDAKEIFSIKMNLDAEEKKEINFNEELLKFGLPQSELEGSRYSRYGKDDLDRTNYAIVITDDGVKRGKLTTESIFKKND